MRHQLSLSLLILLGVAVVNVHTKCVDKDNNCDGMKVYCKDKLYKHYMEDNCAKTCGFDCKKKARKTKGGCSDLIDGCDRLASHCKSAEYKAYMKKNCLVTCGFDCPKKVKKAKKAKTVKKALSYVGCRKQFSMYEDVWLHVTINKMTVDDCVLECKKHIPEGFRFAGIGHTKMGCYCAKNPANHKVKPESYCKTKCPGNSAQICGGPGISVYSLSASNKPAKTDVNLQLKYLGCRENFTKKDAWLRVTIKKKTVDACVMECRKHKHKGYRYAGIGHSKLGCWCAKTSSGSKDSKKAKCERKCPDNADQTCGGPGISVYSLSASNKPATTHVNVQLKYKGCYKRFDPPSKYLKVTIKKKTVDACVMECRKHTKQGYRYAGIGHSKMGCWCAKNPSKANIKPGSYCKTKCPDNPGQICGGPGLSVYTL